MADKEHEQFLDNEHKQSRNQEHKQFLKTDTATMATGIVAGPTDDDKEHISKELEVEASEARKLLEDLQLIPKYYPNQRLSILDGLRVRRNTLKTSSCNKVCELPWLILQKVMSYDVQSRIRLLELPADTRVPYCPIDDFDDSKPSSQSCSPSAVHPVDGILALLLCANDFLRQDLIVRLNACQIAIPLILRDPISNELTFPLWALSSIVKSWRAIDPQRKITNYTEQLMKSEIPIVSIIRLGDHRDVSKSKLLNNMIGSDTQHTDYFFHRDCNGGASKRLLGNGLIDMCWYLPSGEEDIFPNIVAFVNLHGDACSPINTKQVNFLSKFSTFCFVLSPGDAPLSAEAISVLKKFKNFALLLKASSKPSNISKVSEKIYAINLKKNDDEIKTRMRQEIKTRAFSEDAKKKSIESLESIALECKINIDSRGTFFSNGLAMAEDFWSKISASPEFKAENLPLQGKEMWQEWAKLDKEQKRQVNRGGKDIRQYDDEIEHKKMKIRSEQKEKLTNLSDIMKLFVTNFNPPFDFLTINCYLHCLKLYLNNLSRDTIFNVHRQYRDTRSELSKFQKPSGQSNDITTQAQDPEVKMLRDKLDNLHGKLIDLEFGLEHLLRETGQLYETSLEPGVPQDVKNQFSHLPGAAAKLLRNGYPLELMDGDAAHVPIRWVQAILNEVVLLLGDPKVFVLSVLGLQSTGKSTLLNTVFGLQFNVSSGRCTRGAYMQLLPISDDLSDEIKCDYILVIDTEGLRAPELDSLQSQKHDSELATFVIGLANETLINIYGEVAGDIDDILQTSVHAFIRMREIKLRPSCQFVHQNTEAGIEKNDIGHDKFIQKLDEMTRYAASEEGCQDQFSRFTDVIEFNDQVNPGDENMSSVHYFKCLWMGNPPMAPVNPGYSRSAQGLKLGLIEQIQRTNCTRLSSFNLKIKDLWDALVTENFVFSFKNSMEIQAYSLLETHYSQWEWDLKQEVLKWEEKVEREVTAASADTQALDDIINKQLDPINGELARLISKTHTSLNEQLAKYFEESKQIDIIAQWKSIFERKLEEQAQLLKNENLCEFEQLCAGKKALTSVRQNQDQYKQQIINRVTGIADLIKSKGKRLSDDQVKKEFTKAWNEIIMRLPTVHKLQDPTTVRHEVQQELISFLGRGAEKEILKFLKATKYKQAVLYLKLNSDRHFKDSTTSKVTIDDHVDGAAGDDRIHRAAQMRINDFLNIVPKFLSKVTTYTHTHVTVMLREIEKVIQGDTDYSFTRQFCVDLYCTVCNYAIKEFENMVKAFNTNNDPVVCLENELKDDLYNVFKNKCFQIEHGKAVASTLRVVLIKAIKKKLETSLARQIINEMKQKYICFKNKQALKAKILVTLAENLNNGGDINDFDFYISFPSLSFQFWAKEFAKQYCDSLEAENGLSQLQVLTLAEITDWIIKIKKLVKDIYRNHSAVPTLSTNIWLQEFSEGISEAKGVGCHVDVSTIVSTSEDQEIDIVMFAEGMEEELEEVSERLKKKFKKLKFEDMKNWDNRPQDILGDMAGCCAKCPFCEEICDNTTPCGDGVKHQVEQHRPGCTNGWHSRKTRVLTLGVCTSRVTGKDKHSHFYPFHGSNKKYPYKEYYKIYPDWTIPADLSDTSLYWKWFVANYVDMLAKHHSCKPCPIPDSWKSVTWEQAKEKMERKYN